MKRAFDPVPAAALSTVTATVVRVGPTTVDCMTKDRRTLYDVLMSADQASQVGVGQIVVVAFHNGQSYVSALL